MLRFIALGLGLVCTASPQAMAQANAVAEVRQPSPGAGAGTSVSPPPATPATPPVYFTADELPSFVGGDEALGTFYAKKLQYLVAALDQHLSGKVIVTFIVDNEGRLRDPRVVRGLGHGLDEEALRLVRLMPWWNPGRIKGQPVWVSVTMPIVFRAL